MLVFRNKIFPKTHFKLFYIKATKKCFGLLLTNLGPHSPLHWHFSPSLLSYEWDHLSRFPPALSFFDSQTGWGKHIIWALVLIAIFPVVNLRELPKSPADCPGQDGDKPRFLPSSGIHLHGQRALFKLCKLLYLLSSNVNKL